MRLKPNADMSNAVQRIREQAVNTQSVAYPAPGISGSHAVTNYDDWVRVTETQLRNFFLDPVAWLPLRGAAYWFIMTPGNADFRVGVHIQKEVELQRERLEALATRLERLNHRLSKAAGSITVIDTNVLLHYEPPEQVNWIEVCQRPEVRLVIPLRVIEELDEKKYLARPNIADRSRRLLSQLWAQLAPTKGEPVEIRPGVTIEVPVEAEPRLRPFDADEEVLDTAEELRNAGFADVTLITADCGMSLRAVNRGLRVLQMPASYLRKKE